MPKSMKNMLLLAKVQSAIDTDPVPTPAANAILVRAMTPQPISAEFVERNLIRAAKGNYGSLSTSLHREIDLEVELAGSGAAGTAPKWAPLLLACGFSETLLAATSATYNLVSSGEPFVAIYAYLDGLLFKMLNCKGNTSVELNAKGIPVLKMKFLGEYQIATDVTFPTGAVFTGFQKPLTVGKVNTPTFTMFGFSPIATAFSFDVVNALIYRDEIGYSGANSNDRKPTASATIELPAIAVANFGEIVKANAQSALQIIHGTTAGNIVEINMPAIQINAAPAISNDNEIARIGLSFSVNPSAGNDEIVIVCR